MKKLIAKMKRLGLSPKKEFLILGVVNLVLVLVTVLGKMLAKNTVFLIIGPGFAVIFSIMFLTRYDTEINKMHTNNLLEFSDLFNFFRIYIKNGYNVYSALKEISYFANENLKELLSKLLDEIDEDKSVQPFINFAHNFNEIIIEELMISIYQMIDEGEQSNYLTQFEFIFDKFSESLTTKELKKKDSRLGTLSSSALVGSCFLIVVIAIGVVGVIGDMTNGI
ncbi:MAG: hypothetical protein KBS97_00985 [Firmicutes bacterium]|nr:hypothetical protein [Candidatus Fiminaster equi]